MIVKQSQHAKTPYLYSRGHYKNFKNLDISQCGRVLVGSNRNKHKYYIVNIHMGFDIETTHITDTDYTTMYIWSISIYVKNCKYVYYGNTWLEFIDFLNILKSKLDENEKCIIWIANLGYEFQFMKKHLNVTSSFFRNKRQPFYIEHENCIIFQEALNFFGNSLKSLAKNKCNTQKAIGDLDYTKQRFYFNCNLDETESGYTDNDVLILCEWGKYYYDNYLKNHFKPVSIQSIIRQNLKKSMFNEFKPTEVMQIRNCYPNKELYNTMMCYLYRGGYVHANVRFAGEILKNIPSNDITSAYPFYMLVGYVPQKFKKENVINFNAIKNNVSLCWFGKFTFYKIHSTTNHSIESISKCLEKEKVKNDNGRVMSADKMTVYLNELDFNIYEKFYTWDKLEVTELYTSNKIKLPHYVISNLFEAYTKKALLKAVGKPYSEEKQVVNSFYGVMVTKFNEWDLQYNNTTCDFTLVANDFEKVRKKAILLPQWGVWITSGIRHFLLSTAYKIIENGGDCIYFDTDSIKYTNIKHKTVIDKINIETDKKVKRACQFYNLDYNIIKGLGNFDLEGIYPTFKTLGCKRYIYVDESNKFHQVIAGLPKTTLIDYSKESKKESLNVPKSLRKKVDLFKFFDNNMTYDYTTKLTSKYIDEGFTVEIEGHKVSELSCLTLDNSPFTLTLQDTYLDLMEYFYNERQEKRLLE